MNGLKVFSYEGNEVRTVQRADETWWVLRDVCGVLDLTTPARVAERLDEDEVSLTHIVDSIGRRQETTIINESGLYNVILRSDKPDAKKFKRWVTSEVLPSIRNTGSYSIDGRKPDSYTIEDPIERAKRWIEEQEEKQKLIETVQEQAPKAEYFDSLVNSNLLTNFRDTAKELGYSQTEFTGWLIAKGYVYKDSKGILKPYETYRKQGLFQMKDFKNPYNHFTGTRTFVTVKGKNTFRLLMQVPD